MRLPIKVGAAIAAVVILGGCATPAAGTATQPDPIVSTVTVTAPAPTVTVTAPAPAVSDACYRAVKAARKVMTATMTVTDAQGDVMTGIQPALMGASRLDTAPIEALTGLIRKSTSVTEAATATIIASNWKALEAECEAGR